MLKRSRTALKISVMGLVLALSLPVAAQTNVKKEDTLGKGGFTTNIDSILAGVGGLKAGGDGGVGRKGVAGIGYTSGHTGGGIDDLLTSEKAADGGGGGLDQKKNDEQRVSSSDFLKGGSLTGGRSRASIQRVVMQNMAPLRHAYSQRLRNKPGLSGTITVKFSINEFGKVLFVQMTGSTLNDSELEQTVVTRIKTWVFEKIDKPGDVTEVVYPFVFSQ